LRSRAKELGVNIFSGSNLERGQLDVETWFAEGLVDTVYVYSLDHQSIVLPWRWYEITQSWVDRSQGRAAVIPCMICTWPMEASGISLPILSAGINAGGAGVFLYEAETVREDTMRAIQTLKGLDPDNPRQGFPPKRFTKPRS
jgi:hypothetical protein